jgi:DNA-binding transcriptional regulator PaaX
MIFPKTDFKPVKRHTLFLAPLEWFSVQDYLSMEIEEKDPLFLTVGGLIESIEENRPSEKTLSMRFLRYYRQGLLERKRAGHKFLYKLTEKGIDKGLEYKGERMEYIPKP